MPIQRFYSDESSEAKAQEHVEKYLYHLPLMPQTMAECAAYTAVLRFVTRRDEYPIPPRNERDLQHILFSHCTDVIHSLVSQSRTRIDASGYRLARRLAEDSISQMLAQDNNAAVLLAVSEHTDQVPHHILAHPASSESISSSSSSSAYPSEASSSASNSSAESDESVTSDEEELEDGMSPATSRPASPTSTRTGGGGRTRTSSFASGSHTMSPLRTECRSSSSLFTASAAAASPTMATDESYLELFQPHPSYRSSSHLSHLSNHSRPPTPTQMSALLAHLLPLPPSRNGTPTLTHFMEHSLPFTGENVAECVVLENNHSTLCACGGGGGTT